MKVRLNDECLQLRCGHTMNKHREMLGLVPIEVEPPMRIPKTSLAENYVRAKRWVIPEIPKHDRWAPMFGTTPGDWFLWFAWRPVRTLDRGVVWMRPVWKRQVYKKSGLPGPSYSWWQYVVER